MVTMRFTEADHDKVTEAVRAAEAKSAGEIVTIVAARSDSYHDVGLHYAVLAMLLVPDRPRPRAAGADRLGDRPACSAGTPSRPAPSSRSGCS